MKNKKSKLSLDISILISLPALAAVLSWLLPINYLESMLLFFGLPALYISWRKPSAVKRSLGFALPLASIAVLGDYFAVNGRQWQVPTIFPFRLFGAVSVENIIWFFLVSYLIVSYYELFFDHLRHKSIGKRMPYLYLILAAVILILGLMVYLSSHPYSISFFYLKSGLVLAALPLLAFTLRFPRFLSIFLKTTPYFAALFFLNEIVGLHKGYWIFPGSNFIGWVQVGAYRFPWEELIFYIVLFSSVIITYFEIFDDDRLRYKSKARRHLS